MPTRPISRKKILAFSIAAGASVAVLASLQAPVGAAGAAAAGVRSVSAPSRAQILGWLNAQRAASGIPPLRLNADWSAGCAAHNHYEQLNAADGPVHTEDPSKAGYSSIGATAAARSVLSMRFSEGRPVLPWSQSQGPWFGNPFEEAPIHLSRILDPELNEVGIDQIAGWLCIDTDHWQQSWAQAPQVFTYPADGTKGWKNETTAGETPTTPEEILGLPVFHSTVRFYAFTGGTGGTMIKPSSASLRGPEGDVPVRWINRNDDVSIPADAVIFVPTKSLQPGATYTASVTVATSKGPLSKSWSFTLGGSASGEKTPTIRPIKGSFSLGWLRSAGSRFKILTSGGGQIRLTVTTKRIGGSVVARFTTAKTDQWHSVSVPARQVFHGVPKLGRYEVTITGPGCKTASGVVTVSP